MIRLLDNQGKVEELDYFADTFTGNSKFRATIIDENSAVLGDSRLAMEEIEQMENQADRPEICKAKESGIGVSRRFSNTLNKNHDHEEDPATDDGEDLSVGDGDSDSDRDDG